VADRPTSYVGSRIARRLRSACRAAPNFIPRQVARLAPSATILSILANLHAWVAMDKVVAVLRILTRN
jgi:hypothetical protein